MISGGADDGCKESRVEGSSCYSGLIEEGGEVGFDGGAGDADAFGMPCESVDNACSVGAGDVYCVAAVVVPGWAHIVGGDSVRGKSFASVRRVKCDNEAAGRSDRVAISVVRTVEVGPSGFGGVAIRGTHEVERQFCLWD